jgi:hypothetical protein
LSHIDGQHLSFKAGAVSRIEAAREGECLAPYRARSAQAEIPQDEQDDHDGADEPDDSVHDSIPFPGLKWAKLL